MKQARILIAADSLHQKEFEMTYSVVYRTGGTQNFKWCRTNETFLTRDEAINFAAGIEKMGYKTMIYITKQLNNIGLPETYDSSIALSS